MNLFIQTLHWRACILPIGYILWISYDRNQAVVQPLYLKGLHLLLNSPGPATLVWLQWTWFCSSLPAKCIYSPGKVFEWVTWSCTRTHRLWEVKVPVFFPAVTIPSEAFESAGLMVRRVDRISEVWKPPFRMHSPVKELLANDQPPGIWSLSMLPKP